MYQTNGLTIKDLNMKTLNQQGGVVLVTSLVFLVVLTLLAISTMSTSNFELIMATNVQSQTRSLANAEIAVSEGEAEINSKYNPGPITLYIDPSASTSPALGLYEYNSETKQTPGFVDSTTFDWDGDGTNGFITGPTGNKYVIEYLGGWTTLGASLAGGVNTSSNSRYVYRVNGQGTVAQAGARGGAERFVQTLFLTE